MALIVVQWGGELFDSPTAGNPVEIWSNSMAVEAAPAADSTMLEELKTATFNYWVALRPNIDPRVRLDFIKANEFDVNPPFHQITDPTNEATGINSRGDGDSVSHPLTTAMRMSLDNNTRNRRARGGFFIPCPAVVILDDWRWTDTGVAAIADITEDYLNAVNALTGLNAAVWSRAEQAVFPVSRLRVGNVPDNISRRKNALAEVYAQRLIP